MRIEQIRKEIRGDGVRLRAEVRWKDDSRPDLELFFELPREHADSLVEEPDPFVMAAFPMAAWAGEDRIVAEGDVCPRLREGLQVVGAIFESWYPECRAPSIEPSGTLRVRSPRSERRSACFLSGGVDSLALLKSNLDEYPATHPGRFADGLILFGLNTFDFEGQDPVPQRKQAFDAYCKRLRPVVEEEGVRLLPVVTNTRVLYPDFETWTRVGCGAGMVSSALALRRRLTDVWVASEGDGPLPPPCGSHATVTPHLSTAAVAAHHGQAAMTRYEKTVAIAGWKPAHEVVRPCLYHSVPPNGNVNCGRCEKCVRTMLGFLVEGMLDQVATFEADEVTPAMIEELRFGHARVPTLYAPYLEALERIGRFDLAEALRAKLPDGGYSPSAGPRGGPHSGGSRPLSRSLAAILARFLSRLRPGAGGDGSDAT